MGRHRPRNGAYGTTDILRAWGNTRRKRPGAVAAEEEVEAGVAATRMPRPVAEKSHAERGICISCMEKQVFVNLFRGEITPLSSSYNIPGLVPVCWLLFQCF